MIPRFNYLLSPFMYLLFFFRKKEEIYKKDEFIKLFINSRTGLKLLLSSISNRQLHVGVQVYTCQTVFQAIKLAGHIPVFIDISNNFKLDLVDLKKKIDRIDVLILTHTFGFTENIEEVKRITKGRILIEDCAHAFLSKFEDGSLSGTKGDAAFFSTGIGKFPPIGLGGYVIINNLKAFPYINDKIKLIKSNRSCIFPFFSLVKTFFLSILMRQPLYGLFTYRLGKKIDNKIDFINKFNFHEYYSPQWVVKILFRNHVHFKNLLFKQQNNAKTLYQKIINKQLIPRFDIKGLSNNYIFPLLVEERELLFSLLLSNGIEPGKHFCKCIFWATEFGYKKGECPNSEILVNKILTIPIHCGVSNNQIIKISKIINETIQKF